MDKIKAERCDFFFPVLNRKGSGYNEGAYHGMPLRVQKNAVQTNVLFLPVGLHQRPDPEPQGIDLDEAFGVSLVEYLILLESCKIQIEE